MKKEKKKIEENKMGPIFAWKQNARDRRIVLSTGGPTLLMRPPTSWRRLQTKAKKWTRKFYRNSSYFTALLFDIGQSKWQQFYTGSITKTCVVDDRKKHSRRHRESAR